MGVVSKKRTRNKRFDYEPRFYDPKKDERLKRRMRIKSKAMPHGKKQNVLTMVILFVLVLIVYLSF